MTGEGKLVAGALAGAWRDSPPALALSSDDLAAVAPPLLRSGAAGLAWRRLRDSDLRASAPAFALQQAYRLQTVRAAVEDRRLEQTARLLEAAGVTALLGKGWAAARHYPEAGLRPYGDFDLYVSRAQHLAARRALQGAAVPVDLHVGCAELDDRPWDTLVERARPVALGGEAVKVFGPEDHLRLLALHLLRHGAWRALWLCDLGAVLESAAGAFDWDRFLEGDPRRTDWACCALVLAHALLRSDLSTAPPRVRRRRLPRWLIPTVLEQWGEASFVPHGVRQPMSGCLRDPAGALRALRLRWPNGIEATVGMRGPFNALPRLPFQLAECVTRTARFTFGALVR